MENYGSYSKKNRIKITGSIPIRQAQSIIREYQGAESITRLFAIRRYLLIGRVSIRSRVADHRVSGLDWISQGTIPIHDAQVCDGVSTQTPPWFNTN